MPITKARQLAELIANSLVDSDEISVGAVTTSKLADTLDFSSKTMVMADNQLSGDKIHGGTVSAFASTGIDDNASTTAVTILSDGKVGIGTDSPQARLHTKASVNNFRIEDADTNGYANIGVDNSGSLYLQADHGNTRSSSFIRFFIDGNEDMLLDEYGQLALTSNPSTFFLGGTSNGSFVKGTNTGNYLIFGTSAAEVARFTGNAFQLNGGGVIKSNGTTDTIVLSGSTGVDAGGNITLHGNTHSNASQIFFKNGSTNVMTIAGGNVGIGSTSPDAKLDVTRVGDGTIAIFQNSGLHGFEFSAPSSTALQIASRQGSKNLDLWANTLSFSAGGSARMTINSEGFIQNKNTNFNENVVVKEGSTGSFTFTSNELNPISGDNISYFIFVSVYRPTSDVTNDVASLIIHGIMPRGANSTFNTLSTLKGSGISTLTATNSINSLVITTDSGTNFRCAVKVISMGGTS